MIFPMTMRELIEKSAPKLTQSERKLASALLADYPFAGLLSVQLLAERADISPPSISRFVTKIGLSGYPEMQRHLLEELRESESAPSDRELSSQRAEGGYLASFLDRAAEKLQIAGEAITEAQFERVCNLLSDRKRKLFALGGRISDIIAQDLVFHLRQTRGDVFQLPRDTEAWPEYLLRMNSGDVLFLVDFRRYEPNLYRLAEMAAKRRIQIIVMTDRWMTPAKRHASEVLVMPIETDTVWDSYIAAVAITEALATRVAENSWDKSRKRIEAWDAMRSIPTE